MVRAVRASGHVIALRVLRSDELSTLTGARPVLGSGGGGGKSCVSDFARFVSSRVSSMLISAGSRLMADGAELVRTRTPCTINNTHERIYDVLCVFIYED